MSYYFPFGAFSAVSVQNISYSFAAITASRPQTTNILVPTASLAISVQNTPPAGTSGTNVNIDSCTGTAPNGPDGVQGPTGSKGTDVTTCPPGTIECTGLNISLSAVYGAGLNGINYYVPSGSQYSIVCLQIPPGCTAAQVGCPSSLPTGTYPSIP
jgi:hypothetical protein